MRTRFAFVRARLLLVASRDPERISTLPERDAVVFSRERTLPERDAISVVAFERIPERVRRLLLVRTRFAFVRSREPERVVIRRVLSATVPERELRVFESPVTTHERESTVALVVARAPERVLKFARTTPERELRFVLVVERFPERESTVRRIVFTVPERLLTTLVR